MLINRRLHLANLILSFLIHNLLLVSSRGHPLSKRLIILGFLVHNLRLMSSKYHLLIINLINLSFRVHNLLLVSFRYLLKHHHSLNCHQPKHHLINFINHINLLRFKYPNHLELKHPSPRQ